MYFIAMNFALHLRKLPPPAVTVARRAQIT